MSKFIVIIVLIAILISLASGLYFMMKDSDNSDRMARALTIRITLSIVLFIFLMVGYYLGWFQPGTQLPY